MPQNQSDPAPQVIAGKVTLTISQWGRPFVYIASYQEKCIPGCAVSDVSNRCVFSTRDEAIKWAKSQLALSAGATAIDWDNWKQDPEDYPYYKNLDNPNLDPTFIATVGNWPDEPEYTIKVHETEICQVP